MLEAVVLAGGASTRMGTPKAALIAPDGQTFIVKIARTLLAAGFARITVVTGPHHAVTLAACAADPLVTPVVRCLQNPEWPRGQFSSLLTALESIVDHRTRGLLVTLVDVPLVSVGTVRRLVDAWTSSAAPVVRPRVGAVHGHPVIFDRSTFELLRTTPLDVGARAVVRHFADRVRNVDVEDAGCLVDIDTPDEYSRLVPLGGSAKRRRT